MSEPGERTVNKAVDSIQQRLTDYACDLNYTSLSPEAIHAAKVRIIDTLGALIGGFFGEACGIARNIAAQMPSSNGATIIGTRMKTTPDMAAFVNAISARYPEMTDSFHWPGSLGGHASDTLAPVLAVAEYAKASGREFLTSVVLAYEVFCRIAEVVRHRDFDNTILASLGSAVAAGKLLGLTSNQLSHCISMAVVPNVVLMQARLGHLSMFKAVAAGQAGRAGVFAALLARAGMEGPHLPFEGKAGWCDHVARQRFALNTMGGNGTPFRILDTQIKNRACNGTTIASVLAAEKVAPLKDINDVKQVIVEVNKHAKEHGGDANLNSWNPDSRESADHSIPYVVAVTLIDGTITLRWYNDAHLLNPQLGTVMKKTEVLENQEFTKAYHRRPQEHWARVTVVMNGGERLAGETGGDEDDLAAPKSDAQIEAKFRELTEDVLDARRVNSILDRLWHVESLENAAEIPSAFVLG